MFYIPDIKSFRGDSFISDATLQVHVDKKSELEKLIEGLENDPSNDLIIVEYESIPAGSDYRCSSPDDTWSLKYMTTPKFGTKSIRIRHNDVELTRYSHIYEILADNVTMPLADIVPDDSCAVPIFTNTEDVVSSFTTRVNGSSKDRLASMKVSLYKFKLSVLARIMKVCLREAKNTEYYLANYYPVGREKVHRLIGGVDTSTRMTDINHPNALRRN
jgi:hypothetical protein